VPDFDRRSVVNLWSTRTCPLSLELVFFHKLTVFEDCLKDFLAQTLSTSFRRLKARIVFGGTLKRSLLYIL
jgi:hypothetical protein